MNKKLIHPHDRAFVEERLSIIPDAFKPNVLAGHIRNLSEKSRRESNLGLIALTERADEAISHPLNRININASENDLKATAKIKADWFKNLSSVLKDRSIEDVYLMIVSRIRENGINSSLIRENPTYTEMQSLIRKSMNPSWWLRNLRRVQNQDIERIARTLNIINKHNDIYVSDEIYKRYIRQQEEQQKFLDAMVAENEIGDSYFLGELKATSVSDPYIKKSELMVRCRGFENYAQKLGHQGLFITMTCPSKYHSALALSGDANSKWNHSMPIDGQEYLKSVWARIRASLARANIYVYGFRVAEPHHDGTPHWHMLFFVEPKQTEIIKNTFLRYCLEEDSDEQGALENRIEFIDIDPNRGSATGYIAKYISKNINGEDLDTGVYGENPTIAAQRVTAWASLWGIRQFQQIGGASVSVWRELRRMEQIAELDSVLEQARVAADTSDWEGYQVAMGGINIPRADRPISVVYWTEVDTITGEIKQSQYGDLKAPSVYGLEFNGKTFNTRPHQWKIYPAYD